MTGPSDLLRPLVVRDDNGWEVRDGAEIRLYGVASISGTRFTAGEYSQITNKITIGNARKNISYENDQLFGIGKVLGIYNADGGDRWRSAAVQFRYGLFNATLNLFTGDPGLVERDRSVTNYFHEYYSSEGALDANQRAGVLSFGFGSFRLGRNSEIIRHIFQNESLQNVRHLSCMSLFHLLGYRTIL